MGAVRDLWNPRRTPPGIGLLRSFLKLGAPGASAITFRDFARKWGVLGICRHGYPPGHHLDDSTHRYCEPLEWNRRAASGWEPIKPWQRYAEVACAITVLSKRLRKGEAVEWSHDYLRPLNHYLAARQLVSGRLKIDWGSVLKGPMGYREGLKRLAKVIEERQAWLERGEGSPPALWNTRLERHDLWQVVTDVVNEWLTLGAVRPWLLWERDPREKRELTKPRLVFAPEFRGLAAPTFPLFGALALQLAFVTISEKGLFQCLNCGNWGEPDDVRQQWCKQDRCLRARNAAYQAEHRAAKRR